MRVTLLDPVRLVPYHEEMQPDYTRELARRMARRGWRGRPLVAVRLPSGEMKAITGSHRLEAAVEAGLESVPVAVVPEEIFRQLFEKFDESQWYSDDWAKVPSTSELVWHLYRIDGAEDYAALVEEDIPPDERE